MRREELSFTATNRTLGPTTSFLQMNTNNEQHLAPAEATIPAPAKVKHILVVEDERTLAMGDSGCFGARRLPRRCRF